MALKRLGGRSCMKWRREREEEEKKEEEERWAYHSDGSEGHHVVVLHAVAPGVPAGVLSLLQDVHLTAEVHLLVADEAVKQIGKRLKGKHCFVYALALQERQGRPCFRHLVV